ncbi:hypothetical protein LCGC14_1104790 [marine sediment metagenome]|uniref:Uncharacterized protein n=1 Tax=marine sediment metagenome TaxID=412755 RepID=A0A0F9M8F6_9ZZZZ
MNIFTRKKELLEENKSLINHISELHREFNIGDSLKSEVKIGRGLSDTDLLCCHLNDLLYEIKIVLPINNHLQRWINEVMKEYQAVFRRKREKK